MKYMVAAFFALLLSTSTYATCYGDYNKGCGGNGGNGGNGGGDPTPVDVNQQQDQAQDQAQQQQQDQAQQQQQEQVANSNSSSNSSSTVNLYGVGTVDPNGFGTNNGYVNNGGVHVENRDRIQHTPIPMGQNCINGVCDATNTFYVTGGYDEAGYNSINLGIAIPFGGSGNTTSSAMKAAYQSLLDRNLHEREVHQAQMAQMCMQLHQMITIAKLDGKQLSPELWNRCYTYEHHFPDENGPLPPHNGDWNPQQVSPHVRNDETANGGVDKYKHGAQKKQ